VLLPRSLDEPEPADKPALRLGARVGHIVVDEPDRGLERGDRLEGGGAGG
jgi:hypothetical protein